MGNFEMKVSQEHLPDVVSNVRFIIRGVQDLTALLCSQ